MKSFTKKKYRKRVHNKRSGRSNVPLINIPSSSPTYSNLANRQRDRDSQTNRRLDDLLIVLFLPPTFTYRNATAKTDRQTARETDRQTDRQTIRCSFDYFLKFLFTYTLQQHDWPERQTDRQTDRQTGDQMFF
jgi:hypothetical protein